ncbi:CYTH domain-containing protein [Lutimonas sp.]|uniref:CYTH domain-containing protein n=1 Tax=Lutimonas sp. TaxID=1872403 RepID=UPI003D9B00EA
MDQLEIERKFLLRNDQFIKEAYKKERIVQGFLSSVPERTVRIRLISESGFITVKGIGNTSGTTRFEWEKEISKSEAVDLLALCETGMIDKERYYVKVGVHTYEIDVFALENQGLVLAEIELANEFEEFEKPEWLGKEVTGIVKYYNSSLAKNPYKEW